ncbi:MAG: flagellar type III secretion system pore protein FliP [Phycisphaerae bacterium]|nr:flagellar type III secretion system pore protein FliP [Phycisphaerae bacterium]
MIPEHGGSSFRVRVKRGVAVLVVALWFATPVSAQSSPSANLFDNSLGIPDARAVLPAATDAKGVGATLQIMVLLTVLTLVPSILIMTTSFTRILIVLTLLRQAMGTQQLPPGQVILGLSLFITMLVMAPTWSNINEQALTPYMDGVMGQRKALEVAADHLRVFMYRQITQAENSEDIYLFLEYRLKRAIEPGETVTLEQIPTTVLIPAFIISELKTAFIMGFRIYLPFLVIDMVIASILISMGMMMLPPVLISLPFKLLLFVLADGWHLIVQTLLYSFVT